MKIEMQNLFSEVTSIRNRRLSHKRAFGEDFNIFSVLRLSTKETVLHSRFIAELLNPSGSHGQGCVFLAKFLDIIGNKLAFSVKLPDAIVKVERNLGLISTNYQEGGFIDIVIDVAGECIIIENKIYAGDQRYQLIRYKNFRESASIIYLTPLQSAPSANSIRLDGSEIDSIDFSDGSRHKLISYKNHILPWIEFCYQETHRLPRLRETLYQYLTIVKEISNINSDDIMSNEIANEIISVKANLESFLLLTNSNILSSVKNALALKFVSDLKDLTLKLGFEVEKSDILESGRVQNLVFRLKNTQFFVCFGMDEDYSGSAVGVGHDQILDNDKKLLVLTELQKQFGEHDDGFTNQGYIYYLYLSVAKIPNINAGDWKQNDFAVLSTLQDGSFARYVESYFSKFKELLVNHQLIN